MKTLFYPRLLVKLIAPKVHIKKGDEEYGTEFEWDTNTIYYTKENSLLDLGFMRHLREFHFFETPETYSTELWTILHELGHYFNPDEEEDYDGKDECAFTSIEEAIKRPDLQNIYYNSPDEFAATEWAIEWINDHPKLAEWFSKRL